MWLDAIMAISALCLLIVLSLTLIIDSFALDDSGNLQFGKGFEVRKYIVKRSLQLIIYRERSSA